MLISAGETQACDKIGKRRTSYTQHQACVPSRQKFPPRVRGCVAQWDRRSIHLFKVEEMDELLVSSNLGMA